MTSAKILLHKIQSVGASTSGLKWFNSYLTNRYQVVRIHSSVSDPLPVECGVRQGSIQGPLLFSIYVVVNFLFQLIFIFALFWGMVMYANEFKTKEKQKLTEIKN